MNALALNINNITINSFNGLYSLNSLHEASGKLNKHQPAFFMRNKETQELAKEIERSANMLNGKKSKAFTRIRGGESHKQGTYVCKELVYRYAMWISPKFALIVIRTFDALVNRKTTKEDRTPLKNAVTAFVSASSHHNYSQAYTLVHEAFNVESIEDIPLAQLSQAVEYVYGLIFKLEDCEPTKLSKKDIFQKSHSEVCAYLKAMTDEIKRLGGKLPSQPKIDTEAVANAYIHQHIAFNRMTLTLDEKGEAKVRLMPRDHRIIADSSLAKIISDPFGIDKKYLADIAQAASARLGKLIGK